MTIMISHITINNNGFDISSTIVFDIIVENNGRYVICSNYPNSTLWNKMSIAILGDRILMKHISHNRLSIRDKARTQIESSKYTRKDIGL